MRGSEEGRCRCLAPPSHQQELNCFPLGLEEPPLTWRGSQNKRHHHDGSTGGSTLGAGEMTLARGIIDLRCRQVGR